VRIRLFLLCTAVVIWSISSCTDSRIAGPSTEQGNPQIVATVVDANRQPIGGALVTVFMVAANSDSTEQPKAATSAGIQQTDHKGVCSFEKLLPGSYALSVADTSQNRAAFRSKIVVTGLNPAEPDFIDTLVVTAPGSIRGVVSRGGVLGNNINQNLRDGFIQVKLGEIDRSTVTGPDGRYAFANLPAGAYTIYYYATDGFYMSKRENIVVAPGNETIADTVILKNVPRLLPPQGLQTVYDTSAGIVHLYWRKVLFDSLRWYEVKRINLTLARDTIFICQDTVRHDTLNTLPKGTRLDYVVRSVDRAYNPSLYAGTAEITVW
jgi:uncharacterized protein (DUF2141 family)